MIIVSVKAPAPQPPPPPKCTCSIIWDIAYQATTPEVQQVAGSVALQATTPENQATSDIKFVLEYTVS
jgi:hypothetical protein